MRDPLLRYRVMADVVGVVLLVLVFVGVPLHVAGHPAVSRAVSPVHGALYMVLVLCVLLLARAHHWSVTRTVLVALGGTVPVVSFLVERRVAAREAQAAGTPDRTRSERATR